MRFRRHERSYEPDVDVARTPRDEVDSRVTRECQPMNAWMWKGVEVTEIIRLCDHDMVEISCVGEPCLQILMDVNKIADSRHGMCTSARGLSSIGSTTMR